MATGFDFTPEEAQPIAQAAIHWLTNEQGRQCEVERTPWSNAPYRTTLAVVRGDPKVLVEAQGAFNYHTALADLATWLIRERLHAEMYLAVSDRAELQVRSFEAMKRDGVGLLLVSGTNTVTVSISPRNPALTVLPDPTLKYGDCAGDVAAALAKFNLVDRKDGLRDMCEVVERETDRLAIAAARKGLLTMNEAAVLGMNWSTKINTLASANAAVGGTPLLDDPLKQDFHSFRGARNLVDHPARNVRDQNRRARQFAERMAQGPRLVAELVSLRRKVSRK